MKKLAATLIAISSLTGSAFAADLPARTYTKAPIMQATYNWSGFYVGVSAGADWDRDAGNLAIDPGTHLTISLPIVTAAGAGSRNGTGFIGGGQIGYNWQAPQSNWVFGLEADFSGVSSAQGRAASGFLSAGAPFTITEASRTDWLSTVRGRIGYAWDRSLLYVTGGLAIADVRVSSTYNDGLFAATGSGTASNVRAGYALGAGWEQSFAPNWSAKLEYLYTSIDRAGVDYTIVDTLGATNVLHVSERLTDNILRAGVNYHFH